MEWWNGLLEWNTGMPHLLPRLFEELRNSAEDRNKNIIIVHMLVVVISAEPWCYYVLHIIIVHIMLVV